MGAKFPQIASKIACVKNNFALRFGSETMRASALQCVPLPGQGFKRGSYVCKCARGYYSDVPTFGGFSGTDVEMEHDKLFHKQPNQYKNSFECRACSPGCSECVDDSACLFTRFAGLWNGLLGVTGFIVAIVLGFALFVTMNWKNKVNL